MPAAQNFKNHTRFHPLFHFLIMPLLLLNLAFSIYITIHRWPAYRHTNLWWIVMSIVFIFIAGLTRDYALKNQNRIIRLEERLRLQALLPAADRAHIDELTLPQLLALSFASDAELPGLAHRALTKTWNPRPSNKPSSTGVPTTTASRSFADLLSSRASPPLPAIVA